MNDETAQWLGRVNWNRDGLVATIAQDKASGRVLTLAWMNRTALTETLALKQAVYWSRSRQRLWHKGERSGLFQQVHEIRLDCDADAILLQVTQAGGVACHTGRASCFFLRLNEGEWQAVEPVLIEPDKLYGERA